MNDDATLNQLEELAQRLGITIRYEALKSEGIIHTGGFCRVRGQDFVIINKKSSRLEKIHILTNVLHRYDLSDMYILPSLRDLLDRKDGQ